MSLNNPRFIFGQQPGQLVKFPEFQQGENQGLGGIGGNSDTLPIFVLAPEYRVIPWFTGFDTEPANTLFGQFDEDFWVPAQPQAIPSLPRLLWNDDEAMPPKQLGTDEDFYVVNLQSQPSNAVLGIYDTGEITTVGKVDEDFWLSPAPKYLNNLLQIPQDEGEFTRVGVVDEDFITLPVPWATKQILPPLWTIDPSDLVNLAAEEDYQWYLVPKITSAVLPSLWTWDQTEQATGLYGQFDEDFWLVPVPPFVPWVIKATADEGEITVVGKVDEDNWFVPLPTFIPTNKVYFYDEGEFTLVVRGDEDYWVVVANQPTWYGVKPTTDEGEFTLFGAVDEDLWSLTKPGAVPQPQQPVTDQADAVWLAAEEDYWYAATQQLSLIATPRLWQHDQHEQAFGLFGCFDEDYWQAFRSTVQSGLPNTLFAQDENTRPIVLVADEEQWLVILSMVKAPSVTQLAMIDLTETLAFKPRYITRMNDWLDLEALHRSVT